MINSNAQEFTINLLNEFSDKDKVETENGSTLIKNIPVVAPRAYLHAVYRALSDDDIGVVEADVGITLPDELKCFYKSSNGLKLFGGAISLYGLRDDNSRSIDSSLQQPFDIVMPNALGHNYRVPNTIYIGSYKDDGSIIGYNLKTGAIHRQLKTDTFKINHWTSLSDFLNQEYKRLSGLYKEDGLQCEGVTDTTPNILN
ncbi:hypothetical protein N474_25250 [Pseudoalteromonas luteoviolacea CPMOR-2]|uniref:SMI1/KNR4 family protein n=1 Tax=Pseudoalteromonas luteoviolacea TaxID=43657 RepID=UPI0007B095F1|nr:SMI1/KNR4 family protein [Pseudoalteromonas luteoviolacea]KZN60046.1 hypothetical protein N474_25250 [Pseudoalteromonas luteoviolacea CPMOR-2]